MLLVFLGWHSPLLAPLRLATVATHEFGHAVAAVVTGGAVEGIQLSAAGGETVMRGGWPVAILCCGYPAPALLAMLLIQTRARPLGGLLALAAFRDIFDDLQRGDAAALAELTSTPPMLWSLGWGLLALGVLVRWVSGDKSIY